MCLLDTIKTEGLDYISNEKGITVKKEGNLALFRYNLIDCKFDKEWKKECRGHIVDLQTLEFVCRPFDKFFNLGEKGCARIDINSMKVREKLDGSLIKLFYYNDKWNISTVGMIDAGEAWILEKYVTENIKTLKDVFLLAINNDFDTFTQGLDQEYTYMFELCSHYNRVIVEFNDTQIYFLGKRHNKTGVEYLYDDKFMDILPKEFDFSSNSEFCGNAFDKVEKLGTQEGVVVVDKYGNKAKIKTKIYVALAYFNMNLDKLDEISSLWGHFDEFSEIEQYFPQTKETIQKINNIVDRLENQCRIEVAKVVELQQTGIEDRELRKYIGLNCACQPYLFQYIKGDRKSIKEWLINTKYHAVSKMLSFIKGSDTEC